MYKLEICGVWDMADESAIITTWRVVLAVCDFFFLAQSFQFCKLLKVFVKFHDFVNGHE